MPVRIGTVRRLFLGLLLTLAPLCLPAAASAHPLGNFTVNRAVAIEIGERLAIRYIVDMAELPALREIQLIDTNGNGVADASEADTHADGACNDVASALAVELHGSAARLRRDAPAALTFPPGAGGLRTLRLECRFTLIDPPASGEEHDLRVRDWSDDPRIGWHEVTARAVERGRIISSDVPAVSESALLTRYPEAQLARPPDVRSGALTFILGSGGGSAPAAATTAIGPRQSANDPLAALVGGELSPAIVVLALLVSLGLGALHALSPGHGKTLVAAYVLGAGASPAAAIQVGLSVAVSHTAGVFALGLITLLASELFLPERVIAWLSLVSGVIVAGLGIVLLTRQLAARGSRAAHPHAHEHGHEHHHDDDHGEGSAPSGRASLTWRSALALGFAGGAVPSASAVIVLLVAISSDRLLFGATLILAFGIGMAVILGGLGLLVARIGSAAADARGGWLAMPWVRRLGRVAPVAAGAVVLVTGVAFALTAASQLG